MKTAKFCACPPTATRSKSQIYTSRCPKPTSKSPWPLALGPSIKPLALITQSQTQVKHDDGSTGSRRLWKVSGGKLTELSPQESQPPLILSSSGCYIILYEFCPGVDSRVRRFVIYAWQGARAARQDIAAGALCLNDVQVCARTQGSGPSAFPLVKPFFTPVI